MTVTLDPTGQAECTKIRCISRQMDSNDWVFKVEWNGDHYEIEYINSTCSGPAEYALYILSSFFTLLPFFSHIPSDSLSEFNHKITSKAISEISFKFIGDDSFYGERLADGRLAKTGMGSSATFIVSFVG